MHHGPLLNQQPQDTLSSHGQDLVSHLATSFANQQKPIYSVEIPIITTCTEIKVSGRSLGVIIPRAGDVFSNPGRHKNPLDDGVWVEPCSWIAWRNTSRICRSTLHLRNVISRIPSPKVSGASMWAARKNMCQLYSQNAFGLASPCIWLLQDRQISMMHYSLFFWQQEVNVAQSNDIMFRDVQRILKARHGLKWNMLHNCSICVAAFTFTCIYVVPHPGKFVVILALAATTAQNPWPVGIPKPFAILLWLFPSLQENEHHYTATYRQCR